VRLLARRPRSTTKKKERKRGGRHGTVHVFPLSAQVVPNSSSSDSSAREEGKGKKKGTVRIARCAFCFGKTSFRLIPARSSIEKRGRRDGSLDLPH